MVVTAFPMIKHPTPAAKNFRPSPMMEGSFFLELPDTARPFTQNDCPSRSTPVSPMFELLTSDGPQVEA